MNYRFHPAALREYAEATRYYAEVSPSLAASFVTRVESGIDQILINPQAWQPIAEDIRRCLVGRFPFGIYYTIEDDRTVLLLAIMHLSRKPGYWHARTAK